MASGATGSTQDVTRDATWMSANPELLRSLGAGAFTAAATRGETNLTATSNTGLGIATFHVLVLEDGTFVVRGTVSDTRVGVPGAHVQIKTGTGADRSATTDTAGRYALYGAAGTVTLSVTDTDYESQDQTVDVTADTTANFSLLPIGIRPDVNGTWLLTFTASPACLNLPEDARVRVYPVSLRQTGPAVQGTLTLASSAWAAAATVPIDAQLFSQSLTFTFPVDPVDGPWVYEHLAGGLDFTLEGHASATYAAGRFDGVIDGRVRVLTNGTWPGTTCEQPDHHWRLERMPAS